MLLILQKEQFTVKDYESLEEGAPYQLIAGQLVMSPSPTYSHQEILGNIFEILSQYVREHRLGKVIIAPMDVYLTDIDVYQPDLLFVRSENVDQLRREGRVHFPPDLVVEILSSSTAYYDYSRKKQIYAERGVKEYWIVDPQDRTVEVMINGGNLYQTEAILKGSSVLESQTFPGLRVKLEDIFAS
jgi:Uma2 family endonuclease